MANKFKLAELEGDSRVQLLIRSIKRHPAFRIYKRPGDLVRDFLPSVWRMSTHHFRHLPTTVIVGAQKAGTTQLFAHLVTHPRCYEGSRKEVNYFSKNPNRSVGWYRSHFPLAIRVTRKHSHVMEASPSYLPTPSALRQMRQVLPKARVIVLLREPVSRAFSHYQHRRTRGLESRSFGECVAEEIRTNTFPANLGVAIRPKAIPMLGYLARGYYALQLELLLRLFPRNKVLVLDSAGLFRDTVATCERVFNFMGLEAFDVRPTKIYNRGYYKEKIDPVLADALRAHFQPYNELLPQVIEQEFSWTFSKNGRAKAA